MWAAENWRDYELIDTSDGCRLERWGKYILQRPDPQVIWRDVKTSDKWRSADAVYNRSSSGGGAWSNNKLPEKWTLNYGDLVLGVRLMGFKHTGVFPEQAVNWDWFSAIIKDGVADNCHKPKILNLFAYTGGATVAAAAAGASVCHVDASKGMVAYARENAALSGLAEAPIRYIVDDCKKFVEREIRRGNKYEGIIMDPPSYGRGPGGELWKLEDSIAEFVGLASLLLSDKPLFFLINSYTTGLSPLTMKYITELSIVKKFGGHAEADELALKVTQMGGYLPCGASVRWTP